MKRKLINSLRLLLVAAGLCVGESAWATSTTYDGSMYTYDVVFGTPNAATPTAINVQTDFTTDASEQSQTMLTLSIDGTVLAGNQAGGRTYAFTTAPTTGTVTFKATGKFVGGNYDFFHIQGTKEEGGETASYNIVSSPYALPSGSGETTVLRIFGENITASYVYTPRTVLYGFEVTIDLDNQKVDYIVTYASKGSSGTVTALSNVSGSVPVPDGITLTNVTGLNMPRCGSSGGNYYDNVAFYNAVPNETLYTATFTANSGAITPTVTIYSDAGRSVEVTNGELSDGTTYYYRATLHGYENYEGSFTVNGANPSVNFTMTALEKVSSLSVYARISGNNYLIKTIDLDDKYVGDQISFAYPKYYKISTTLYQVSNTHYKTHGGYYKWNNYTLDGNDLILNYDGGTIENVVYYSEGENISGMTADAGSNADIRCSGGQGGRSTDELSLTTLGTGVYNLCSQVWGSANEKGTYTFRAAGSDVLVHALTGSLDPKNVSFNVVSGTAAIKVQGSTNAGGRVLDYVYIQKLDDATVSVYNGDFENSTWDKGWLGTGSDKATAFAKQTSSQTWGATGNFAEMWTNTSFSSEANLRQILVNVPAGSYTLSADILNNVSSSGGVLYATVGNASDVTTAAESATGANESVSFTVAETSNVVLGFKTTAISTKSGWIAMDNFVLQQAVPVTVSAAGFATYVPSYDLDFTGKEIKAYKVKVSTKGVATLTEVSKVPAGTPVLLYAEGGATEDIPVTTGAATVTDNDLVAGTSTTASEGVPTIDGDYTNMILNNVSGIGFYFANGQTVATNRAYLHIDTDLAPDAVGGGSRMVMIFADDETTGVHSIDNGKLTIDNDVYDLQGRRVAQPTQGLYIVNGKKVVIK